MNCRLYPTRIENVSYSFRFDGQTAVVRLFDSYGCPIPKTRTEYTVKKGETYHAAKNYVLERALSKFEKLYSVSNSNSQSKEQFFTAHWNQLSEEQKLACAGVHNPKTEQKDPAIIYFVRNVLPKLDFYGPGVTPLQLQALIDELLFDTYTRKKYQHMLVNLEDAKEVPVFFQTLTNQLADACPKNKESLQTLLESIKNEVLENNRLRSYMEHTLRKTGSNAAGETLLQSICADQKLKRQLNKYTEAPAVREKLMKLFWCFACNEAETKRHINNQVRACNQILDQLHLFYGDVFPYIELPYYEDAQTYQTEQQKSLDNDQRLRFARMMMEQSASSFYAAGALIMLTVGPRTQETCGITFGQVLNRRTYGVISIQTTNKNSVIREEGKNQNFARIILLMNFVLVAVLRRREYLLSLGYTQEQVDNAFIVCDKNDPMKPVSPNDYSSAVRTALTQCGCSNSIWEEAYRTQRLRSPDVDPMAYILRRDAISVMTNCAGMDPLLVDALVGHELPSQSPKWDQVLCNEDAWAGIVAQMERFIYIPEYSMHPRYHPVDLEKEQGCTSVPTQEVALRVQKGKEYLVTYSVPPGTELVQADLPTDSQFAFEHAPTPPPYPTFLLLPLPAEKAFRNAVAFLEAQKSSNPTSNEGVNENG